MHGLEILLGLAFNKMHEQEDVDLFLGSVELVLTSTEVQFMIKHGASSVQTTVAKALLEPFATFDVTVLNEAVGRT